MATQEQTQNWLAMAQQLETKRRQVFTDIRELIDEYTVLGISASITPENCPQGLTQADFVTFVSAFTTLDAWAKENFVYDAMGKITKIQGLR